MPRTNPAPSTLIELFSPAPPAEGELLSDAVARQIAAMIEENGWTAGHRLPPERELSEQMGVSRIVIREAFRALTAMGVVEAHVGRGRFVAGSLTDSNAAFLVGRWLDAHESEVRDLNAVRELLEGGAARQIDVSTLPTLVERLHELVTQAESALVEGDPKVLAELDAQFHKAPLESVANRPLRVLAAGIIEAVQPSAVAVLSVPSAAVESWEEHKRILRAFEAGDRELAAVLISDHQHRGYLRALKQAAGSREPTA
jgi:GntR family transcriptional repressor for pyruvate dehydrogenase complex